MAFDEVRLPECIEANAVGGPQFKTTIIELSSGFEKRNIDWSETRGEWDISYGVKTKENFNDVVRFFYARRGMARGFRFKDWSDFELEKQAIGIGDGNNADFQIFKRYSSGGVDYDRELNKIVAGTAQVFINNVLQDPNEYDLDLNTGLITFTSASEPPPGAVVAVACEFDVPVRFNTDKLNVTMKMVELGSIPQLSVVEVKIS
jgi:uncharacterized protein (TIGR02217 family)